MKRVEDELGGWKARIGNFDRDQQLDSLLSRPVLQSFFLENPDIPRESLLRSMLQLRQYVKERESCENCPGLDHCPNMMQGYQPDLFFL